MIKLNNITKKFGNVSILNGINLDIPEGASFALLGPSGCGKTTLLRLIAGFDSVDSGEIQLQGNVVSNQFKMVPPYKRFLSMVFQDLALWPHMTVFKNIEFVLGQKKNSKEERMEKIESILTLMKLEKHSKSYPHQLSGGEKQRLALARALVNDPKIILFDEPVSSLDADLKNTVLKEIKKILTGMKITSIYVTHDQKEAESIANKILLIINGKIKQ